MKKICIECGKEYETSSKKSKFCSKDCSKIYRSKLLEDDSLISCKICGFKSKQIYRHIQTYHKMSIDDYCSQFKCQPSELISESSHKVRAESTKNSIKSGKLKGFTSENNPSKSDEFKSGRNSVWSINFKGYDGLSDEEKIRRIGELSKSANQTRKNNNSINTTKEYYMNKGFSEKEAEIILKERQSTFSLKKCIDKYGLEEGKKIFRERQERWQNTLKSKPEDEILRINKLKANNVRNIIAYSNISQKLFNSIYINIFNEYSDIYFATNNKDYINKNGNCEYEVIREDGIHRYFLDFYIKDNNKVIEFDGDYWHSAKRGTLDSVQERLENLKKLGYTNILIVKECDYNNDPEKVLQECLKFIRS